MNTKRTSDPPVIVNAADIAKGDLYITRRRRAITIYLAADVNAQIELTTSNTGIAFHRVAVTIRELLKRSTRDRQHQGNRDEKKNYQTQRISYCCNTCGGVVLHAYQVEQFSGNTIIGKGHIAAHNINMADSIFFEELHLQSDDIWGEHLICYGLDLAETKNACKISLKGKIGLGGNTIVLKTSQARIDVYALNDMDCTERTGGIDNENSGNRKNSCEY